MRREYERAYRQGYDDGYKEAIRLIVERNTDYIVGELRDIIAKEVERIINEAEQRTGVGDSETEEDGALPWRYSR